MPSAHSAHCGVCYATWIRFTVVPADGDPARDMADDFHGDEATTSMDASGGLEPLACVSCRSRKLKCDRTKPACTRCVKVNGECVYPESRRKPTFKRRNVKELEARLGNPFPSSGI